MALTGEAFGFSLAFNVIIALGVFLFFGAIRRAGGLSKFYQPKRSTSPDLSAHDTSSNVLIRPLREKLHQLRFCIMVCEGLRRYMRTSRQRPKALPNSVWGWIVPTFRYKQDEVVAMAGYDAAMYLRILAFGKLSTCALPQ